MSQSVPIFIVLASETFDVVATRHDGAFLRSFRLVRQHMGLQVFEKSPTVTTAAFLVTVLIKATWT